MFLRTSKALWRWADDGLVALFSRMYKLGYVDGFLVLRSWAESDHSTDGNTWSQSRRGYLAVGPCSREEQNVSSWIQLLLNTSIATPLRWHYRRLLVQCSHDRSTVIGRIKLHSSPISVRYRIHESEKRSRYMTNGVLRPSSMQLSRHFGRTSHRHPFSLPYLQVARYQNSSINSAG